MDKLKKSLKTDKVLGNPNDFKCKILFDEVGKGLQREGSTLVAKVKGVIVFKVKGGPNVGKGIWTVDCKSGSGSVEYGTTKKADCTVRMKDRHIVKIIFGQITIQKALLEGKIRISGNMGLLMKLQDFMKQIKNIQSTIVANSKIEFNGNDDVGSESSSSMDEEKVDTTGKESS